MIFKINSLFRKFLRINQKQIQTEYLGPIQVILNSPLWDGSDEQIYQSLPQDLTKETLEYAKTLHKSS